MKIVYVNRCKWPSFTPAASFVTFNAHSLASIGIETSLLVGKGTSVPPNEVLANYYGIAPLQNLSIEPVFHSTSSSTIFYLLVCLKVWFLNKRGKIDAIITRDSRFLPYLNWLKRKTGAIVILESHNYFMEITDDLYMQKALKQRKKYLAIENKWLPRIDALLCILTPMAELYRKHIDPKKVFVALPGTVSNKPLYKNANEIFWIGYIGSYHEQRDFETVLTALNMIEDTNVKLMIIGGRENELPIFNALIDKFNVRERVKITGWVSYAEMLEYIKELSIGLVPMVDNLYNRSLTAPMKILDYLSHGIPILSADLPSAREFVGDKGAGMFYTPGNQNMLVEKINFAKNNPALLIKMSQAAIEQGKTISWQNRAFKIKLIIESLINDTATKKA